MPWSALIPIIAGVAGGAMQGAGSGGFGGRSTGIAIAPGLSKYTANDQSQFAHRLAREALADYVARMRTQVSGAGRSAQGVLDRFRGAVPGLLSRAAGDEALARRSTDEVAGVYRGFGRESEGVARETHGRALKDIDARAAVARARGGYSSATEAERSGARGEADYGLNRALAEIASQRSQLVGGALERGRGRELDVRQGGTELERNLLATELPLMERRFTLPASFQQQLTDTIFNARLRPEFLYPTLNVNANVLRGSMPGVTGPNPLQGIGSVATDLAGLWLRYNMERGGGGGGTPTPGSTPGGQFGVPGSAFGPFSLR